MSQEETPAMSKGEARRRAMMDAAWGVILDKGFTAITLDDIISRSGGSKSTLYALFGSKDGLLKDVMREKCEAFSAELSLTLDANAPPEQTLHHFAALVAQKQFDDEVIRFSNLLLTEGHVFPSLLHGFLCGGPERTDQHLTRYLADVARAGKLNIPNPEQASALLLDMLVGRWTEIIKAAHLDGPALETFKRAKREKAKAAVDFFLAATLPR